MFGKSSDLIRFFKNFDDNLSVRRLIAHSKIEKRLEKDGKCDNCCLRLSFVSLSLCLLKPWLAKINFSFPSSQLSTLYHLKLLWTLVGHFGIQIVNKNKIINQIWLSMTEWFQCNPVSGMDFHLISLSFSHFSLHFLLVIAEANRNYFNCNLRMLAWTFHISWHIL